MQMTSIEKGIVIHQSGQELNSLRIIVKGSVRVEYPGGQYMLSKGDVIGLGEVFYKTHFLTYTANEEISVLTYSFYAGRIEELVDKNADIIQYFMTSVFRQMDHVWTRYSMLKMECRSLYQFLQVSYEEYGELCEQFHKSPSSLPQYEELEPLALEEDIENWLGGYYKNLHKVLLREQDTDKVEHDFFVGLLSKASEDIHHLVSLCSVMEEYRSDICHFLMNEHRIDLFEFYTTLYFQLGINAEHIMSVSAAVNDIIMQLESEEYIEDRLYKERIREYEERIKTAESNRGKSNEYMEDGGHEVAAHLKDSLNTILNYAGCTPEEKNAYVDDINKYKETVNKNSTSDRMRELRLKITRQFYHIYTEAFLAAMDGDPIPDAVNMFFQFGYMDEELAGVEYTDYLCRLAREMPSDPAHKVYTVFEWLKAIYNEEKEPCRNEFDVDFTAYVLEQKRTGKISDIEARNMLKNRKSRVMYELENMFPSVNKITYGNVSTFCPVFSEHNVLRSLPSTLVTAERVEAIFNEIKSVDFSAYYRETIYSKPEIGLPKEVINVEVLPDIILMPNIGIRGVMWQEIEEKKRTTPARMMTSIFLIEDLNSIMIRLTGEFRWEMCRRIQGMRWNDVSDASLTSDYFDYLQFYKKNLDLSASAKDKVKIEVQKAKNSYKEMFIRDYCKWVLYEKSGSPRLNKVCRKIIFKYCPFSKNIREALKVNPLYQESIERYEIRALQRKRHMDNIQVKVKRSGRELPEEMANQMMYLSL